MAKLTSDLVLSLLDTSGIGSAKANAPQDASAYTNYDIIEWYTHQKDLPLTMLVLPLTIRLLRKAYHVDADGETLEYIELLQDLFSLPRMMIDLRMPLSEEEEDLMLSATLLRAVPAPYLADSCPYPELIAAMGEKLMKLISLVRVPSHQTDADQQRFFENLRSDKLALLIMLAERGNFMGHLYEVSGWSARRYIYETRSYFFPLAIYAKEHFESIQSTLNILTEKMRSLIEVAEILLSRYEAKESELIQEILALEEENGKLRTAISHHLAEKE